MVDSMDVSVPFSIELQGMGYLFDRTGGDAINGNIIWHLGGQSGHIVMAVQESDKERVLKNIYDTKKRAIESHSRFSPKGYFVSPQPMANKQNKHEERPVATSVGRKKIEMLVSLFPNVKINYTRKMIQKKRLQSKGGNE
jgi:hypothetical protein